MTLRKFAVKDARAFRTDWGAACPNNTGCNEWYTPAKHIELVRSVLGEIDLDPASHPFAQQTVRLRSFSLKRMTGWVSLGSAGYFVTRHIRKA